VNRNPLEDDPERESRIRARAYRIWDEEGRPHGRDVEFWERARELDAIESAAGAGQEPNPMTPAAKPAVEEAELQANLGEFPSRLTDQGDRSPTPEPPKPRAKRKRRK